MHWSHVFGWLLVLALLALAGFFGWRQVAALRRLKDDDLPDDEKGYERRKAYRRLISSALTLLLAGLLGWLLVFYEGRVDELLREGRAAEERGFLRDYIWLWVAFLLLLLAVVMLAAADLWATRRYALRQYRKLQADRRAMIEQQVGRLRRQRNGDPG